MGMDFSILEKSHEHPTHEILSSSLVPRECRSVVLSGGDHRAGALLDRVPKTHRPKDRGGDARRGRLAGRLHRADRRSGAHSHVSRNGRRRGGTAPSRDACAASPRPLAAGVPGR